MALISCPECGKTVSNEAKACPNCGYPIMDHNKSLEKKHIIILICSIIAIFSIAIIVPIYIKSKKKESNKYSSSSSYNYYNDYSYSYSDEANDYTYSSSSTYNNDDSKIFNNLTITDFSCSKGSSYGKMSCKVKNNNSYTVSGYFRVNFYDKNGTLIYTQLMGLDDVDSGESIVCDTLIPKDEYPDDYKSYDFTQASLTSK